FSCVSGFFFFFQAEDGIRDRNVTGVQTCALPIFIDMTTSSVAGPAAAGSSISLIVICGSGPSLANLPVVVKRRRPRASRHPRYRSEERRVGKECRSRGGTAE